MPRIRSVKPFIWSDDRIGEVSRDARLLYIGMITQADDDGRLVASGTSLAGAIYPYDDITGRQVDKWRDELATVGLIDVYIVGRATYAALSNWTKHQRIQKKQMSSLPPPPVHDESTTSTRPVRDQHETQSHTERTRSRGGSGDGDPHPSATRCGAEGEVEGEGEVEVDVTTHQDTTRRVVRAAS